MTDTPTTAHIRVDSATVVCHPSGSGRRDNAPIWEEEGVSGVVSAAEWPPRQSPQLLVLLRGAHSLMLLRLGRALVARRLHRGLIHRLLHGGQEGAACGGGRR